MGLVLVAQHQPLQALPGLLGQVDRVVLAGQGQDLLAGRVAAGDADIDEVAGRPLTDRLEAAARDDGRGQGQLGREAGAHLLLGRGHAGLEIQHMGAAVGRDLDAVGLGRDGEGAARRVEAGLARLFDEHPRAVLAPADFHLGHPRRGLGREGRLAGEGGGGRAGAGQFGHIERREALRRGGPLLGVGLEGGVDGGAAGALLHRLVRPWQQIQAQHIAGVDGVGVAGQGLGLGHRQFERPGGERRGEGRAGDGGVGAGFVEGVRPPQDLGPAGQGDAGAARQDLQPPQPAGFHGRRALAAFGVQQEHLGRAGGLGEVVGRQADAPLGRGQAHRLAHGPRQERVDRRALRPDAFLQPGQDQAVGPHQARLDGAEDAQARMGRAARAHRGAGHQALDQLGEAEAVGRGQPLAFGHQGAEQLGRRLAAGPGPEGAGVAVFAQRDGFGGLGQGAGADGGGGDRVRVRKTGEGGLETPQQIGRASVAGLLEADRQVRPAARAGAAQAVTLQGEQGLSLVFGKAQAGQRMLEDGQQPHRIAWIERRAGQKAEQPAGGAVRQRRAGRGVGLHAPARQAGGDAPGQVPVGRDQGGGLARGLERLAQQQGDGGGAVLLGRRGDQRQALKAERDRVLALGLAAEFGDLVAPVGGLVGRAQGLVDQATAPAAPGVSHLGLVARPQPDLAPRQAVPLQEPLHGALGVLLVHRRPGLLGQLQVEARQDHRAQRRAGHSGQQVGGGRGGAGRAGGDQGRLRRIFRPLTFQRPQQAHPPLRHVDQAEFGQAFGPGVERDPQEVGRALPVLGHLGRRQGVDPGAVGLLDLQAVEEAGQGVGQLQGGGRVDRPVEQAPVLGDQTGQLEAPAIGRDGRRQVERQVARLERRLALVEVAERAHLGQQHRLAAGHGQEGLGQGAGAAAGRRQDDGLGQALGAEGRERFGQSPREVEGERTMRRDGEPARPRLGEGAAHGQAGALAASRKRRCSAASRASGSEMCMSKPSMTAP